MSKSTAATSPARRAQLERIKAQRRADRANRDHARRKVAEANRPFRVTYPRLIMEIQRIAMGGVMPRPSAFDRAKPTYWPTAKALCEQFAMSWADFAVAAGLRVGRRVGRML